MTEERYVWEEEYINNTLIGYFCDTKTKQTLEIDDIEKLLNEQENKLNQVLNMLEEADIFTDDAIKHDTIAYKEMLKFDNKDAYDIACGIKEAIKVIKDD